MRKLAVGVLLVLFAAATGGPEVLAQGNDTLVVGIHADALTMDPHNFRHRETETILRNMFDGFVTRTPDGKVVPELAESITQVDATTWEIKLRKGVRFHDGSPFTAEDAAFTINRIVREGAMGGSTSPRKGLFGTVNGARVVDESTIRVTLDAPMPHFLAFLPFHMVVPKSVGDSLIDAPVGTGPFRFVEWVKGSHVVMERFDDYYGGSPDIPPVGPARLKRVIFRVIPEPAARLAALQAGEIDIMTEVPADFIPTIERDPNLQVLTANGTRSFFIDLNVNEPPFNDVRVRKALNYAIDKKALIDQLLSGLGTQIPTLLSPQAFGYRDLDPYPYDPEKARRLLAEAGYDASHPLRFTLDVRNDYKTQAQAVAFLLKQVGVQVDVEVWPDYGTLRDIYINASTRRQAWFTSWGNASLDPEGILPAKLYTNRTGGKTGYGRGNFSGYSNAEVDRLLDVARTTFDQEERRRAFERIQEILYEDVPEVFLYIPQDVYAARTSVKNWRPSPDSRINLHDVYKE